MARHEGQQHLIPNPEVSQRPSVMKGLSETGKFRSTTATMACMAARSVQPAHFTAQLVCENALREHPEAKASADQSLRGPSKRSSGFSGPGCGALCQPRLLAQALVSTCCTLMSVRWGAPEQTPARGRRILLLRLAAVTAYPTK